jgi:hypothetical protein
VIWANEVPLAVAAGNVKRLFADFLKAQIRETSRPGPLRSGWIEESVPSILQSRDRGRQTKPEMA